MPKNETLYLAWSNNANERTSDMVVFDTTSKAGSVQDYYGTWEYNHSDSDSIYKNVTIVKPFLESDSYWHFRAFRTANATDTFFGKDYAIPCGVGP